MFQNIAKGGTVSTLVTLVDHVVFFAEEVSSHLVQFASGISAEGASHVEEIIILSLKFLKTMRDKV